MGVLSTPVEELSYEERVIANHLIVRLKQVDRVMTALTQQLDGLAEKSEAMGEQRDRLENLSDDEELSQDEVDHIVKAAKQVGEESIVTRVVAEQTESLYNFYVELASAVETDTLTPQEAAEEIVGVEQEVQWLTELEVEGDRIHSLTTSTE